MALSGQKLGNGTEEVHLKVKIGRSSFLKWASRCQTSAINVPQPLVQGILPIEVPPHHIQQVLWTAARACVTAGYLARIVLAIEDDELLSHLFLFNLSKAPIGWAAGSTNGPSNLATFTSNSGGSSSHLRSAPPLSVRRARINDIVAMFGSGLYSSSLFFLSCCFWYWSRRRRYS